MKQTAVEWLAELIECGADLEQLKKCLPKAKAMEKEQIIEAHIEGFYSPPFGKSRKKEAEQYYNKTFKLE